MLSLDADRSGPGKLIALPITAEHLRLAPAKDGSFWVGGTRDSRYEGLSSGDASDSYLARIDKDGRTVLSEKIFRDGTRRSIEDLAALPSGSVVFSERRDGSNWIVRQSADGRVEWERQLGLSQSSSLAAVGDFVFLAGLSAAEGEAGVGYREDVVLWTLDVRSGDVVDRRLVREGVATSRNSLNLKTRVLLSGESLLILSWGRTSRDGLPVEVAKFERSGPALWRVQLVGTVVRRATGGYYSCLSPGAASLDDGSLVVVCSMRGNLNIFDISPATGEVGVNLQRLPDCHQNLASSIFLVGDSKASLTIVGTRPWGVDADSCTWLGQLLSGNSK